MWVRARRGRSILAAPTKSRPFWSFPRRFTELSPRYPARAQLSAASCEFQSPAARQRLASQRQPKAPFRLSRLHRRTARSRFRGSEADRGRPDWGYRLLHGGSSRSRYVASVKPPVLRCSRLLGISMPSWADPAPGIRRRSARSPLRTCRQRAGRDDSNSVLCPRSLYGGTQIPPGRDPPARAPDRLGASVATWLRTRLG